MAANRLPDLLNVVLAIHGFQRQPINGGHDDCCKSDAEMETADTCSETCEPSVEFSSNQFDQIPPDDILLPLMLPG